jgi:hypothetical protein
MTLPDPKWPPKEVAEFMTQWYYAAISNVSVHEVWPGHYLQFLYAKTFPSDVRKVIGASSNVEGWAHYCEQMVIDEGFHADDPRYRLAQIQDALLRDVRFIAGIKMHTKGMTVAEAEEVFIKDGYQPRPVARSESKRGTSDPTFGYYTMGKLMILKLRDDYKAHQAKAGAQYSLQSFHDTFIRLGPLPLALVRKAMLGEAGQLLGYGPTRADHGVAQAGAGRRGSADRRLDRRRAPGDAAVRTGRDAGRPARPAPAQGAQHALLEESRRRLEAAGARQVRGRQPRRARQPGDARHPRRGPALPHVRARNLIRPPMPSARTSNLPLDPDRGRQPRRP